MAGEAEIVGYNFLFDLLIYENKNGTYEFRQNITLPNPMSFVEPTFNGDGLVVTYTANGASYFSRNGSGLYELIQNLTESALPFVGVDMNEDFQLLALGSNDGNVYIYQKTG